MGAHFPLKSCFCGMLGGLIALFEEDDEDWEAQLLSLTFCPFNYAGGEILIWRQVDNADNQTSWKVFRALVWVSWIFFLALSCGILSWVAKLKACCRGLNWYGSWASCLALLKLMTGGNMRQELRKPSLWFSMCRMHQRDVLDLAWSPDSASLMSGSVDNHCIIWKVSTGISCVSSTYSCVLEPIAMKTGFNEFCWVMKGCLPLCRSSMASTEWASSLCPRGGMGSSGTVCGVS